ncbi:MAG: DMT family transporter [Thermoleophilia bacterium]|nr:DMT family transporter [Thermoleophilia bacterium]
MISVVFGFLTATLWGLGAIPAARSSRRIGELATLAWVMLIGLVVAVPIAVIGGAPEGGVATSTLGWLALAGVTNVAGLACAYAALRRGKVGVVAAFLSTEGAAAALLSIVAGERVAAPVLIGMTLAAAGVVVVARGERGPAERETGSSDPKALIFAAAGAIIFGFTLFASGNAADDVPASWVALPARVVGVTVLILAVAGGFRLQRPSRRIGWAVLVGLIEVAGLICFAIGARNSIAITSVVASQFSVISVLAAFTFERERLTPAQLAGLLTVCGGVALIAGFG